MPSGRRANIVGAIALGLLLFASSARADGESAPLPPSQPPSSPPPQQVPVAPPAQPAGPLELAPAAPPPPAPEESPNKRKVGLAAKIQGGVGQRRLFDDSIVGADLTGGLGLYVNSVDIYFDVQLMFASDEGLPFRHYRFGPTIDFEAFSRVRLGAGISLGGTSLSRETTGSSTTAFSFGAHILGSIDVWQLSDRGALYVLGQLSVDSAGTLFGSDSRKGVPTTVLWGPTLALGARF